jgi:uncharacterized phage-associated protein
MPVQIFSAAKELGRLTDWRLSNLEMNKVLYLAQMLRLGQTEGRDSLVSNVFEAWDYGPVSPRLYHKAKVFGSKPVGNVFHQYADMDDGDELNALKEAIEATKGRSPSDLVAITHWQEGAWYQNYEPGKRGVIIPNEDIYDEYVKRVRRPEPA